LFNAALAVLNAHVTPITAEYVIGVEVILVLFAHITAVFNYRPEMNQWYILIWALLIISIARGLAFGGEFDARSLRDEFLIPTFIVLGLTFNPRGLPKLVGFLVSVAAMFMVLEAVNTPTYSWIFKIQDYYINTRGFSESDFWNKDSPLFVSATRPDGRFFNVVDLHRLSSVFLEPVGSETFCIVAWTFVCSCYNALRPWTRNLMIIGIISMIVGTDGRLALVVSVVILLVCLIAKRGIPFFPFFYLPVVTICVAVLVYMGELRPTHDDFAGRLSGSIHTLFKLDAAAFLGASHLSMAVDCGLAHLILTHSIFGVMMLWGWITLGAKQQSLAQIRYLHGTAAWLSLFMMVSFTFLTIKAAALLWFIFGALQREDVLKFTNLQRG
jgi:putative polymerase